MEERARKYLVDIFHPSGNDEEKVFDTAEEAVLYADTAWSYLTNREKKQYARDKGGIFDVTEIEISEKEFAEYEAGTLDVPLTEFWTRNVKVCNATRKELLDAKFDMNIICTATNDVDCVTQGTLLTEERTHSSIAEVLEENCFNDWSILDDMDEWRPAGEPLYLVIEIYTPDGDLIWEEVAEVDEDRELDICTEEEHLDYVKQFV